MDINYKLKDINQIANKVIKTATSKNLLFFGEMGVGKTTLIKQVAKNLGVKEDLNSPTYSIINEYETENDKVFHFDLFRLKNMEEAYDLGIEEYFSGKHWNLLEWPEIIMDFLPSEITIYKLTKKNKETRTIKMMPMK